METKTPKLDLLTVFFEWQEQSISMDEKTIEKCKQFWEKLVPGYSLNEGGEESLKRYLRHYGVGEVIVGMKISTDENLKWESTNSEEKERQKITSESCEKAFKNIESVCQLRREQKESKLYMKDLYYIRGILKNRFENIDLNNAIKILETAYKLGVGISDLSKFAKESNSIDNFYFIIENYCGDKG